MKSTTTTAHRSYERVHAALETAAKLLGENFKVAPEHHGAAMILSGLLMLAFILEGKDESSSH